MKQQIRKLSQEGKKVKEIATELNIWESQVRYYLNDEFRKKAIEYAKLWKINNRERYNKSRREYNRNYQNKKYAEDSVFREKVKARAKEYSRSKHGRKRIK